MRKSRSYSFQVADGGRTEARLGSGESFEDRHRAATSRTRPGLRLDAHSGAITGVPRESGEYRFLVRLTDGKGHTAQSDFNLTIRQALVLLVRTPLPEGTVGMPYAQNFLAVGGTGKYSFSLDPDPIPGLHLDSVSGKFEGVPMATGRFPFSVRALDSSGSSADVPVEVIIRSPLAIAPVGPLPDATAGRPISSVALAASGGAGHYRWTSRSDLPPGLRLGAEGAFSGAPTVPGTYEFLIQVEDVNGRTATMPLRLVVRAVITRLLTSTFQARLGQMFSEEIQLLDASAPNLTVSQLPHFLTFDAASHRLHGTPTAIGTYKLLAKATIPSGGTTEFDVWVDVPLRIFVEKPFGLEPELSLFRLMTDSCLSHQPYVVVASREKADAVLTCLQCSAANGRVPIQLNAAFDLPARGRSAVPRRSLWTYSFIKAGLTDDTKSTEACAGELGLENSVDSINRNLKGDK